MADEKKPTKKKTAPRKKAAAPKAVPAATTTTATTSNTEQAKSRFSAAVDEAKAGAALLRDEAKVRAGEYRGKARSQGDKLVGDAKGYSTEAKTYAADIARDGKDKASDALVSLSKTIDDTALQIDERFGAEYGDYARKAARSLQSNADKLKAKELEELGEDAREFVRKSPGTAVGIAAVVGYMFARVFRR
ncbi:hypothetical protein [Pseudoblastomonas halimionae]|uniref:DUF883 family protein n=1 Tax=Alteriqipengyuania halimionae TaxID=1926630 RepID=A0A6I4U0T9_9SPHN|nr:hypothetical protein [Alteriqipengyuania halimionae]MXP09649.1 hypothetical protein [Alteriqipengyuania halimionae]